MTEGDEGRVSVSMVVVVDVEHRSVVAVVSDTDGGGEEIRRTVTHWPGKAGIGIGDNICYDARPRGEL